MCRSLQNGPQTHFLLYGLTKKAASFGNTHVSVEEGKLIWVVSGSRSLKRVRKALSNSAAFTTTVYDSGLGATLFQPKSEQSLNPIPEYPTLSSGIQVCKP